MKTKKQRKTTDATTERVNQFLTDLPLATRRPNHDGRMQSDQLDDDSATVDGDAA